MKTPDSDTILHLIEKQAERSPDAIALLSLDRVPITYGHLYEQVNTTITQLNGMGILREDRLAIVLPNGLEMALAFLGIACSAVSAPLNPAYREAEFDFYLADLKPRAVVVLENDTSAAVKVARKRGIPVIEILPPSTQEDAIFDLKGVPVEFSSPFENPRPADTALILHTSGTTSRPKMVPLTHHNLCVSAGNIRDSLHLSPSDRCLNVMPLFHIHGLTAVILASLSAGASVICTPGFFAPQFFPWLEALQPTWYTAVPTMHQAILERAPANRKLIGRAGLRFIRSCSAALPPRVMASLERTFQVPVIEAYGMTEASHQIASNRLPPGVRKPGSVGVAAGTDLAVMGEDGEFLSPGTEVGEIAIRGQNVMSGYSNNPDANAAAFTNGWFRTGDQGYLDSEGYLFITGRLKEMINRGGEKVSPVEVDDVLLEHPAVVQAVTFALTDTNLGEDVGAAVILNDPNITEKELRRFASLRLAPFKVPRRIVIVDEIPKGPTGKIQRIGLSERLGLTVIPPTPASIPGEFAPPGSEVEKKVAKMWCEVLGLTRVSVRDRFLDLGGDSILAAQLVSRICAVFDIDLTLLDFFDLPTVAEQSVMIEAAILDEIEALSDHQANRLLAGGIRPEDP